jgi:hypothetical protein
MHLLYAFPANAADLTPDGRFSVLGGGFETIHGRSFPLVQPSMAVIVKLAVAPAECGREHHFQATLTGPGGPLPPEILIPFNAPRHPRHPERDVGVTLLISLPGLTFPTPGEYSLVLRAGDRECGSIRLEVVRAPSAG